MRFSYQKKMGFVGFVLCAGGAAVAQSDAPAVFVANAGNLEGSVTSFTLAPDGTPVFADRVVTGSRTSIGQPCAGCNSASISISPNGRWLATTHAPGGSARDATIYEVASDTLLTVVGIEPLPDTALSCAWVSDDLLAIGQTSPGAVQLYRWDAGAGVLTLSDTGVVSGFHTTVRKHPSGPWVYANDSSSNSVRVFEVDMAAGTLSQLQVFSTGAIFPLGIEISPNGKWLYGGGGISGGGDKFVGMEIQADGTLVAIAGSPFTSPGDAPKGFTVSPESSVLYVQHGGDATLRGFTIDPESGAASDAGVVFDVGFQGTLGGSAALPGLLFVSDESTIFDGVRGLLALDYDAATGALAPITPTPIDTLGITPESVVVWAGVNDCPPDLTGDGIVDSGDLGLFITLFLAGDLLVDFTSDGVIDSGDLGLFIDLFLTGC